MHTAAAITTAEQYYIVVCGFNTIYWTAVINT
jgi:hypothetical protein